MKNIEQLLLKSQEMLRNEEVKKQCNDQEFHIKEDKKHNIVKNLIEDQNPMKRKYTPYELHYMSNLEQFC